MALVGFFHPAERSASISISDTITQTSQTGADTGVHLAQTRPEPGQDLNRIMWVEGGAAPLFPARKGIRKRYQI